MRVSKVISNNAVLAIRDDEDVVVLGAGIGFGLRVGDRVDGSRIERVFLAEDASDDRLSLMLADIPLPFLRVASRIAELAHERLKTRMSQSLILPLADHLAFAARRHEEGTTIAFPLLWEVSQLYPAEYALGREAIDLARHDLKIDLDPDEAVAIAMHLVNAQFATPGHTAAMTMTETIARIIGVVEQTFGIEIDRHSMDCARFITHLRYVFARVSAGKQIVESRTTLLDAITKEHPEAVRCAYKVKYLIETAFVVDLTDDETAFVGMHLARLLKAHDERGDGVSA